MDVDAPAGTGVGSGLRVGNKGKGPVLTGRLSGRIVINRLRLSLPGVTLYSASRENSITSFGRMVALLCSFERNET